MRDTIDQFMWPFQHSFRVTLELAASQIFEQIGFGLGVRAFLVGFTDDPGQRHPICFESELDELAKVDLSHVPADARTRYADNAGSTTIITSGRHHDRYHRGLLDSMRAEAVQDALTSSSAGADLTFFVGRSARIGAYEIHPVAAVPTGRWNGRPALSRTTIDRYSVTPSFQHAVMEELLLAVLSDLRNIEPPEMFMPSWAARSEIIRKAAQRFAQSVAVYSGYEFASDVAVALDEISAQPYEGRSSNGALALASPDNPKIDLTLRFARPIPLSETRSMRKALEMATNDLHLLCDGEKVHGLAKIRDTYSSADEDIFSFVVVARGAWELRHHLDRLLRVENTRPTFPQPSIDPDAFKSIARRVFSSSVPADAERLWDLADHASKASHGTILVVHNDAPGEAARLAPQAQQVAPGHLNPELIDAITRIDGAVLVDPAGECHAIGVILDGEATGDGDPARGARYNSAVRYAKANDRNCMVVIVSEDGMINVLPDLRRQVTRAGIEEVVRKVEAAVTNDPEDGVFNRRWRHIESVAFYLSADQCDRANDAREQVEAKRSRHAKRESNDGLGHILNVSWKRLTPNAAMDATYFYEGCS
ncbi:hypothetical protein EUA93_08800 [Nocardioides oleivorans]|uniref:DAC domain-containing protein n=1 Tax=Nocardioides oleivorans TaxID=273676 RepID=A0A4Q2RYR4_9ACTN|nr:diadenylate cyclase [Nocardioides oleivorans]RYB94431.1 hypothetical protein EUA93_08800 [Nocardioides oleivorans]